MRWTEYVGDMKITVDDSIENPLRCPTCKPRKIELARSGWRLVCKICRRTLATEIHP